MRYFFGSSPRQSFTLADLQVDMHSHLIPGIDDGAKTLTDSLALIRQMQAMGFEKIITTPHIIGDYFPNTPENIFKGRDLVLNALEAERIEIEFEAAAEYFVDDFFLDLITRPAPLLTFSGRHILIEVSTLARNHQIFDVIFQLQAKEYIPILAHPERYIYYAGEFEIFHKLREVGCEMQINVLSLVGHYGSAQKSLAIKLLGENLIDYLATDLHHQGHIPILAKMEKSRSIQKLLAGQSFLNKNLQ